jgi:hypothetical protein
MIDIFIGNQKLDVTEDVIIPLSFMIDDIADIGSRNTSFSKTITLPGTDNNNLLFGMFYLPQKFIDKNLSLNNFDNNIGTYFNPNQTTDVIVFKDNIQVIRGKMKLLQVNNEQGSYTYEVAIFGDLGGLFFDIRNFNKRRLQLNDLNWNENTIKVYDKLTITDSWLRIGNIGNKLPVYPYINYANDQTPNIEVRCYRPAYPFVGALQKMANKLGYNFTGGFFNNDVMQASLFIPNNNSQLLEYTNNYINDTASGSFVVSKNVFLSTFFPLLGSGLSTDITYNAITGEYTYTGTNNINFSLYFSCVLDFPTTLSTNIEMSSWFEIVKNGSPIGNSSLNITTAQPGNVINVVFNTTLSLSTGDVFFIGCNFSYAYFDPPTITINIQSSTLLLKAPEKTTTPITYGNEIDYDLNCPKNVFMDDVFSSYLKLFNIYAVPNQYNPKSISLIPYKDFYNNNKKINWSDKFDNDNYIIKPISEVTASEYTFTWKEDKDYLNSKYQKIYGETMADYTISSGFNSSQSPKEIDIHFSPSHIYQENNDDKPTIGIFNQEKSGFKKRIESNARLVFLKLIENVIPHDWVDEFNALNVVYNPKDYVYAGMTDHPYNGTLLANGDRLNLGWASPSEVYYDLPSGSGASTSFYSIYWSPYLGEIFDASNIMLECNIQLSNLDIFKLDFSDRINIHGVDYKLNSIKDLDINADELAKCELIKIVDYIY